MRVCAGIENYVLNICQTPSILTLELEALYLHPEAEVLRVTVAAPGVTAEPQRPQSRQGDQAADVEGRQVVPAHIQHLQSHVLREGIRVDLPQTRVIRQPEHHQGRQGPESPVLDLQQGVERQVQVGEFSQIPEGGLGDLGQRVVAAVQIDQIGQVVELQRRKVPDAVVGNDELPGCQGQVIGEQGELLPGALDHQLVVAHASVWAAGCESRGRGHPHHEDKEEEEPEGLGAGLGQETHDEAAQSVMNSG